MVVSIEDIDVLEVRVTALIRSPLGVTKFLESVIGI